MGSSHLFSSVSPSRHVTIGDIAAPHIGTTPRAILRYRKISLLFDAVSERLIVLPEVVLRKDDFDTLLVTERIFSASVQASHFITLATHSELREDSDRTDDAERGLDYTSSVDDPLWRRSHPTPSRPVAR